MKSLIIALVVGLAMSNPTIDTNPNYHTMDAVVTAGNPEIVQFETEDGSGWWIEQPDMRYTEGSMYTITFDSMGTDDIEDDIIVAIVKAEEEK